MQLRGTPEVVDVPRIRAPLAQYAPAAAVAAADDEPVERSSRAVVRRTGLLRSRFVVVADEPDGSVGKVAGSRSFWRVGGEHFRERAAERAWDDLVNDLRGSGWEPDSGRRSDFYVLLRKVERDGDWSILPTIEAYARRREDAGQD